MMEKLIEKQEIKSVQIDSYIYIYICLQIKVDRKKKLCTVMDKKRLIKRKTNMEIVKQ